MRKNVVLTLLCSIVSSLALASCGNNQNSVEKEKLYVGLECNYAPFNWTEMQVSETNYAISGTNTYADGYDVQIAKIIADELDMELVIKKLEWDALIPGVLAGTIDLIIAGMSPTDDRKVDIDFTNPYYTSEHVLLVETSSQYANVTSIDELSGAKIAGQIGTLYDDIAHAIPGVVAGNDKPTIPEIITLLTTGVIDGTVLERPVAEGQVALNSNLKIVSFEDGKGFKELIDSETNERRDIVDTDKDVSIGLAKGREELKTAINEVLASLTTDRRNQLMSDAVVKATMA